MNCSISRPTTLELGDPLVIDENCHVCEVVTHVHIDGRPFLDVDTTTLHQFDVLPTMNMDFAPSFGHIEELVTRIRQRAFPAFVSHTGHPGAIGGSIYDGLGATEFWVWD